jgi:hypothetical protein
MSANLCKSVPKGKSNEAIFRYSTFDIRYSIASLSEEGLLLVEEAEHLVVMLSHSEDRLCGKKFRGFNLFHGVVAILFSFVRLKRPGTICAGDSFCFPGKEVDTLVSYRKAFTHACRHESAGDA